MPQYIFNKVEDENQYESFFYSMKNVPSIGAIIDKDGQQWKRCATLPQMSVDAVKIDPYSSKDFVKVTNKANGTLQDLWDRSAELSQKRADKEGKDPIRETFLDNKEKQTGLVPFERKKEKNAEKLSKLGFEVT